MVYSYTISKTRIFYMVSFKVVSLKLPPLWHWERGFRYLVGPEAVSR
jgi:hypothetical protein